MLGEQLGRLVAGRSSPKSDDAPGVPPDESRRLWRRHPMRGLTTGRRFGSTSVPQVLEVGRQRELLAEVLERLVDGEARAQRRDLEEDAAGLAEVDRAEVEAVDHRGRAGRPPRSPARASPRARRSSRPRRRGGRCRRPGASARRAARRRGRGRRGVSPRASQPSPLRLELERLQQPAAGVRGGAVGADGVEALQRELGRAPRDGRRSAARPRPRRRAARARAPRGRRRPGSRPPAGTRSRWPPRRSSQKSSASGEATRQTIRCTSPAPARPAGTPGNSKKVRSEPALPFSSAKKRW